jgi:hypothetical protein
MIVIKKNQHVWDPKVPTEAVQAGLHLNPKPLTLNPKHYTLIIIIIIMHRYR